MNPRFYYARILTDRRWELLDESFELTAAPRYAAIFNSPAKAIYAIYQAMNDGVVCLRWEVRSVDEGQVLPGLSSATLGHVIVAGVERLKDDLVKALDVLSGVNPWPRG